MNALELKNVCKSYPSFSLKDVSFALPCGCIMGLVGENGAGKSTTIKLILDMVQRDSGSITVFGKEPQRDAAWKEDIGVVLDEVGILECMKAEQVERMMRRQIHDPADDRGSIGAGTAACFGIIWRA